MFVPANVVQFILLISNARHDFKVLAFEGMEAIS
jgi:hypothetical protein